MTDQELELLLHYKTHAPDIPKWYLTHWKCEWVGQGNTILTDDWGDLTYEGQMLLYKKWREYYAELMVSDCNFKEEVTNDKTV